MTSKLQEEIKQTKPFAMVQQELWLNLSRTAAVLNHTIEQKLRPSGLSTTQYNVLRILRGAAGNGLCQWEIGARLVAQVPDVPRILDRMERAGWVKRERGKEDRRMVMTTLTCEGMEVLAALDGPIVEMMEQMFEGMSKEEMERLNELLVVARARSSERSS